jgi:phosphoribosylglycinamide formyltransferase-1
MSGGGFRVGFCASGQGRLVRSAIMQRNELGVDIALVVLEHKASVELEEFCHAHGIPTVRLEKLPRQEFNDLLTRTLIEAALDLVCLTFDRLIPPEVVRHYRGRIINTHMSLLPAFVGFHAFENAIGSGVRYAGVTIHEVNEEADAGAIVAQTLVGVRRHETPDTLGRRLFGQLRSMFLQTVAWYAEGRIERDDQGRIWVREGVYGEFPTAPAVERAFAD